MDNALPRPRRHRAGGLIALSLLSTIGWLPSSALPYEISELGQSTGFTINLASAVASAQLLAFALAVLGSGRICHRSDLRPVIATSIAIGVGACLLVNTDASVIWVLGCRLIFGASAGVASACVNALAGRLPHPEKIFAYYLIALCPVLGCLMFGIPLLEETGITSPLFSAEAGLLALLILVLPMVPVLAPSGSTVGNRSNRAGAFIPSGSLVPLLGLAILYAAQAVVWSFAEEAGSRLGFSGKALGALFMVSAILMAPGAASVAIITRKAGFVLPALFCYTAFIAVAAFCYLLGSPTIFAIGIASFNGIAALLLPVVQAILASKDAEGRAAALSVGAINFGAALGPVLGSIVSVGSDMRPIGVIAMVLFAASAAAILLTIWQISSAEGRFTRGSSR